MITNKQGTLSVRRCALSMHSSCAFSRSHSERHHINSNPSVLFPWLWLCNPVIPCLKEGLIYNNSIPHCCKGKNFVRAEAHWSFTGWWAAKSSNERRVSQTAGGHADKTLHAVHQASGWMCLHMELCQAYRETASRRMSAIKQQAHESLMTEARISSQNEHLTSCHVNSQRLQRVTTTLNVKWRSKFTLQMS